MRETDPSESPIPVTQEVTHDLYFDQLPVSYGEALKTEAINTLESMPTKELYDATKLQGLRLKENAPMVDPVKYNQEHPELEMPLTKAVPQEYADELSRLAQERRARASILSRAPESWAYKGPAFITNMAAGLADPINLAGFGVAGAALPAVSTVGGTIARTFAEGAIGSLPGQAVSAAAKSTQGMDTTLQDVLSESAMSGVGLVGVHFAAKGIGAIYRRGKTAVGGMFSEAEPSSPTPAPVPERLAPHVEAVADAQARSGKAIDVEPLIEAAKLEASGEVTPPRGAQFPEYVHEPIANPSEKPFYLGTDQSAGGFKDAPKRLIGHDLGDGIYLTDNPWRENGIAGSSLKESPGVIHEVKISPDAKLADLNQPLQGHMRTVALDYLTELHGNKAEAMISEKPGHEILSEIQAGIERGEIPDVAHVEIQARAKEMGFDGYHYVESGSVEGGKAHNVAMLFDPESTGDAGGKLKPERVFSPDKESIPEMPAESKQALLEKQNSVESSMLFDRDAYDALEARMKEAPLEADIKHVEAETQEAMDLVKDLDAQELLDPESKQTLEDIKEATKEAEAESTVMKMLAVCMRIN
jgi:hypothetical protein